MSRKRIVVVTGGGSGIGRATAQRFGEDGDFIVAADINVEHRRGAIRAAHPPLAGKRSCPCHAKFGTPSTPYHPPT